jgi:hypothetical protein
MHTVIGAFDDRHHAGQALERLRDAGFTRDCMYLQTREEPRSANRPGAVAADESHGFFHTLGSLFSDLFGTAGDFGQYAEAIRRGGTVVVVDAPDDAAAEKARGVLEGAEGLVDRDERVSHWRSEGWTADETAPTSGEAVPRDASGNAPPPGTSAGPARQRGGAVGARGAPRIFRRADATPIREMARLHEERGAAGSRASNLAGAAAGPLEDPARRIDARVAGDIDEPAQRSR